MNEQYIIIYDWMFTLGLKGNELIVYALLYSFGDYYGSQDYVAKRLNIARKNVNAIFNKLEQKGLIIKTSNKQYKVVIKNDKKILRNVTKKCYETLQKNVTKRYTINKYINKYNNKKKYIKKKNKVIDVPEYKDLHSNEIINQDEINQFLNEMKGN